MFALANIFIDSYTLYMQNGSSDCGLYAIAFATAIAFGDDPGLCLFDQEKMRQHLYHCLEAGRLDPFPHRSRLGGNVKNEANFGVYCSCRMPDMHNIKMVTCNRCTEWFHICCVEVSDDVLNTLELEWLCYRCTSL